TDFAEAIKIIFDPQIVEYEDLLKFFFEIHDFTQVDRQGPDIGTQYRSSIFYKNKDQEVVARKIIKLLFDKGYEVATSVVQAKKFYPAEDYHQNYYEKTGGNPYCHIYKKIFK
ncbi:MAG: peptide-methionine (S)-S-oxide reductase, partial [Candidatus Cloacimonadota bacterium]|nr:peptide-methionine (S)-S-oxide reductase [Candidatus Cloacimonadota bacterium]